MKNLSFRTYIHKYLNKSIKYFNRILIIATTKVLFEVEILRVTLLSALVTELGDFICFHFNFKIYSQKLNEFTNNFSLFILFYDSKFS